MSLTSFVQAKRTGEVSPRFSDVEIPQKKAVETRAFSFGSHDLMLSPDGDDTADGTQNAPLRTIAEAKNRLRRLRTQQSGEVCVWLRAGTYTLTEPLLFDAGDLPDVTFCAFPGEEVLITGGTAIRGGWETVTVNGVQAWARTVDEPFTALYGEADRNVRRTRCPESGYYYVKAESHDGALYTEENTPWEYMLGECAFVADTDDLLDLPQYRNPSDILVRLFHYWKDEMLPLRSYDPATGVVTSTKYCSMSPHAGDRYILENVFEALDAPGEWYLDRAALRLYYVPYADEKPETTVLYTGALEQLLEIDAVSGIAFEGITFRDCGWHPLTPQELTTTFHWGIEHPQAAYSTPACITVRNAQNVSFDACRFLNIGFSALRLGDNVQHCSVTRSLFRNIGGNAVYISGEKNESERATHSVTVSDNRIEQYGRNWANAIGVFSTFARGLDISHNEISDGYYTAISVGWSWGYDETVCRDNRICDNLIYHIGQGWLSDMGGIYTLGVQPGTVISGNIIHDVAADPGEGGYGGWGVYLDEGSSYMLVEKNLVYACGSQGFHQHYGRENLIRNNIFACNACGQMRITRTEDHLSASFERNILYACDSAMYTNLGSQKFTDTNNLYWDSVRGEWVRSTGKSDDEGMHWRLDLLNRLFTKNKGHYTDAVFADPWFRDADNGDFTLADNSPARSIGFVPWNYADAGTISEF